MKLKIWFGIIIPLVIVVLLAIFGSLNIDLSIKKSFIADLSMDDIYSDGLIKNPIQLGKVEIKNDNFMSSRYQLPALVACLVDEDGKQSISPGTVQYVEDKPTNPSTTVITNQYYNTQSAFSDEINAHDSKKLQINLIPNYDITAKNGEQLLSDYGMYDKLVLVESKQKYPDYYFCSTLSSAQLDDGETIDLNLRNNSP